MARNGNQTPLGDIASGMVYASRLQSFSNAGFDLIPVVNASAGAGLPLFAANELDAQANSATSQNDPINQQASSKRQITFMLSPKAKVSAAPLHPASSLRSTSNGSVAQEAASRGVTTGTPSSQRRNRRLAPVHGILPSETSDPEGMAALYGPEAVSDEEARRCAALLEDSMSVGLSPTQRMDTSTSVLPPMPHIMMMDDGQQAVRAPTSPTRSAAAPVPTSGRAIANSTKRRAPPRLLPDSPEEAAAAPAGPCADSVEHRLRRSASIDAGALPGLLVHGSGLAVHMGSPAVCVAPAQPAAHTHTGMEEGAGIAGTGVFMEQATGGQVQVVPSSEGSPSKRMHADTSVADCSYSSSSTIAIAWPVDEHGRLAPPAGAQWVAPAHVPYAAEQTMVEDACVGAGDHHAEEDGAGGPRQALEARAEGQEEGSDEEDEDEEDGSTIEDGEDTAYEALHRELNSLADEAEACLLVRMSQEVEHPPMGMPGNTSMKMEQLEEGSTGLTRPFADTCMVQTPAGQLPTSFGAPTPLSSPATGPSSVPPHAPAPPGYATSTPVGLGGGLARTNAAAAGSHSGSGAAMPVPKSEHLRRAFSMAKDVLGFEALNKAQKQLLPHVLAGKDALVCLPTGGGKSACYILPAISAPGLTVVVLPLLSLMGEAVDSAAKASIPAQGLNKNQSQEMQAGILAQVRRVASCVPSACDPVLQSAPVFSTIPAQASPQAEAGEGAPGLPPDSQRWTWPEGLKLLFVTPERLTRCKQLQDALLLCAASGMLSRFVIDEAHCVTEWGSSWRPDYAELRWLRPVFPTVPITALTATAPPRTQRAILQTLGMQDPHPAAIQASGASAQEWACEKGVRPAMPPLPLQLQGPAKWHTTLIVEPSERPNLTLTVHAKSSNVHALTIMTAFVKGQLALLDRDKGKPMGVGIVYCGTRNMTERMARKLQESGVQADYYHAGVSEALKSERTQQWRAGHIRVLCATVAFSMGIDHKHVRFVIHSALPSSLSTYAQEIGRAGRDGEPAHCMLLSSDADRCQQHAMLRQAFALGLRELQSSSTGSESSALPDGDADKPGVIADEQKERVRPSEGPSELQTRGVKNLGTAAVFPHASALRPGLPSMTSTDLRAVLAACESREVAARRLACVLLAQRQALEDMAAFAEAQGVCRREALTSYFTSGKLPAAFPQPPTASAQGPAVSPLATASGSVSGSGSGSGSGWGLALCSVAGAKPGCCDYCMLTLASQQSDAKDGPCSRPGSELYLPLRFLCTVARCGVWPGPWAQHKPTATSDPHTLLQEALHRMDCAKTEKAQLSVEAVLDCAFTAPQSSSSSLSCAAGLPLSKVADRISPPLVKAMASTRRIRVPRLPGTADDWSLLRLDLTSHARCLLLEAFVGPTDPLALPDEGDGQQQQGSFFTPTQLIEAIMTRCARILSSSLLYAAAAHERTGSVLSDMLLLHEGGGGGAPTPHAHSHAGLPAMEEDLLAAAAAAPLKQLEGGFDEPKKGSSAKRGAGKRAGRGAGSGYGQSAQPTPIHIHTLPHTLTPGKAAEMLPPPLPISLWKLLYHELVRRGLLEEKHELGYKGRTDSRVEVSRALVQQASVAASGLHRPTLRQRAVTAAAHPGLQFYERTLPTPPDLLLLPYDRMPLAHMPGGDAVVLIVRAGEMGGIYKPTAGTGSCSSSSERSAVGDAPDYVEEGLVHPHEEDGEEDEGQEGGVHGRGGKGKGGKAGKKKKQQSENKENQKPAALPPVTIGKPVHQPAPPPIPMPEAKETFSLFNRANWVKPVKPAEQEKKGTDAGAAVGKKKGGGGKKGGAAAAAGSKRS